jgi:hypothetical protein
MWNEGTQHKRKDQHDTRIFVPILEGVILRWNYGMVNGADETCSDQVLEALKAILLLLKSEATVLREWTAFMELLTLKLQATQPRQEDEEEDEPWWKEVFDDVEKVPVVETSIRGGDKPSKALAVVASRHDIEEPDADMLLQ